MLAPKGGARAAACRAYDRLFYVGGKAFLVSPYSSEPAVPTGVELLHLSADPTQIARHHPVRLGLAGDPKTSLARLAALLADHVDATAANRAGTAAQERRQQERERRSRAP